MTSLAALALYDGEAEITAANISTLLAASNNTVAPYWPGLFAGLLKDGRADKLVFSVGGGAPAPAAAAAAAGKCFFHNIHHQETICVPTSNRSLCLLPHY